MAWHMTSNMTSELASAFIPLMTFSMMKPKTNLKKKNHFSMLIDKRFT